MKNYLLKIAFLSTLCFGVFITSCSDDESEDSPDDQEQVETGDDLSDVGNDTPSDDEQNDNNDGSSDGEVPEVTAPVLTDVCVFCREISGSQTNGQGDSDYFYAEGNVCKGEDGKAYLNGVLQDELAELDTYEKYLESREKLGPPCKTEAKE